MSLRLMLAVGKMFVGKQMIYNRLVAFNVDHNTARPVVACLAKAPTFCHGGATPKHHVSVLLPQNVCSMRARGWFGLILLFLT